ncbi:hypothetical protein BTA51_19360 [Hahella sp. CCB-MM4]|uniref:hypothetical protein n=1 Tax=Hahella sp. (strain CCB-MM4) TaxID=1926491 RepID=UPI000B9A6FBA|nr:hypothetical protein [Hahella sp. CCB-MM4]OZG71789.1 hypothetical protein BTA51_19360 [Hahella sp. CCB-MM4]
MKKTILAVGLTAFATITNAGYLSGELDGTYRPMLGSITTTEIGITQPEQLGRFTVFLERENWTKLPDEERVRIRRYMLVYGLVRGKVDTSTFLAQHVLVNDERTGTVYTQDDSIVPISGDMFCSTGEPMRAIETINPVQGTGEYANLEGGQLKLSVIVYNCPGTKNFGNNNMTLRKDGYLKFSSSGE